MREFFPSLCDLGTTSTTQPHWAPRNTNGGNAPFDLRQLPGEIRNMIWELSIPTDRVLVISAHGYYVHALPPPAIAWVCSESRAVALQHGRAYALFTEPIPLLLHPALFHHPPKAWTWFSPAHDRVLPALMGDEPNETARGQRDGLGALARDARHVLVQTDCFYRGVARALHRDAPMQRNVFHVLASFPNARSVGVVRACFNLVPWRGLPRGGEEAGGGRHPDRRFTAIGPCGAGRCARPSRGTVSSRARRTSAPSKQPRGSARRCAPVTATVAGMYLPTDGTKKLMAKRRRRRRTAAAAEAGARRISGNPHKSSRMTATIAITTTASPGYGRRRAPTTDRGSCGA